MRNVSIGTDTCWQQCSIQSSIATHGCVKGSLTGVLLLFLSGNGLLLLEHWQILRTSLHGAKPFYNPGRHPRSGGDGQVLRLPDSRLRGNDVGGGDG
jgi:hypothetical protein